MRFTSPTLLFVFLIAFALAIPAPDKYKHFKDPGCPALLASACIFTKYCNDHLKKGDLFTSHNGELKIRDAPEPENLDFNLTDALSPSLPLPFTTRELDVNWKRTPLSVHCGTLSCVVNREMSERLNLIAGVLYDLIVDYPYDGATGGKSRLFFFAAYFALNALKCSCSQVMNFSIETDSITIGIRYLCPDRRRGSRDTHRPGGNGLWRALFYISKPNACRMVPGRLFR